MQQHETMQHAPDPRRLPHHAQPNAYALLAATAFILATATREQRELIAQAFIDSMDAADGDCDLEPDGDDESSFDREHDELDVQGPDDVTSLREIIAQKRRMDRSIQPVRTVTMAMLHAAEPNWRAELQDAQS